MGLESNLPVSLAANCRERLGILMGYKDISTTMICTHVLSEGGKSVKSPLDYFVE